MEKAASFYPRAPRPTMQRELFSAVISCCLYLNLLISWCQ